MASKVRSISETVHYLYAISDAGPHLASGTSGVAGCSIAPVECDGLVCWISQVPAAEFEEKLAENMQNLDWVAGTSVAHQRAVSAIGRETDVLPARLATVFRSERSLLLHVRREATRIKRDLARVRGAEEWGIKVFDVNPPAVSKARVNSGKDYLKAKAALLPRRQNRRELNREFAEFAKALSGIAVESAAPGKVSSGQRGIAFQTSILVRRPKAGKLKSLVSKFSRRWNDRWIIECTGPWPPYSFVSRVRSD